jgi:hypothetical protein
MLSQLQVAGRYKSTMITAFGKVGSASDEVQADLLLISNPSTTTDIPFFSSSPFPCK